MIESRQGNYGGRLTSCSVVDVLQRVRASLLTNSAVFFSEKINAIRSSTDGAPEPVFFPRAAWNIAGVIHSVTADDIVSAISRLPDKSSSADLLLLSVMKLVADEIAPFLTELFNHFHVYWSLPIHIQRSLYHAGN